MEDAKMRFQYVFYHIENLDKWIEEITELAKEVPPYSGDEVAKRIEEIAKFATLARDVFGKIATAFGKLKRRMVNAYFVRNPEIRYIMHIQPDWEKIREKTRPLSEPNPEKLIPLVDCYLYSIATVVEELFAELEHFIKHGELPSVKIDEKEGEEK